MKEILKVYDVLVEKSPPTPAQIEKLKIILEEQLKHPGHPSFLAMALMTITSWYCPKILLYTEPDFAGCDKPRLGHFMDTIRSELKSVEQVKAICHPESFVWENPILVPLMESVLLHHAGFKKEAIQTIEAVHEKHPLYDYAKIVGQTIKTHSPEVIEPLKAMFDSGILDAAFLVGFCYENLFKDPESLRQAMKWYRKVAPFGHLEAQERINLISFAFFDKFEEVTRARCQFVATALCPTEFPPSDIYTYYLIEEKEHAISLYQGSQLLASYIPEVTLGIIAHMKKLLEQLDKTPTYGPFKLEITAENRAKLTQFFEHHCHLPFQELPIETSVLQGGRYSQCMLGQYSLFEFFTNPDRAELAMLEPILHMLELSADQDNIKASFLAGKHYLLQLKHYTKGVQYLSKVLISPEDSGYLEPAKELLTDFIWRQLIEELPTLGRAGVSIPPHFWQMMELCRLLDPTRETLSFLPLWIIFQALIRMDDEGFKRHLKSSPGLALALIQQQLSKLICDGREQFKAFLPKIQNFSEKLKIPSFAGWIKYIEGYFILKSDQDKSDPVVMLKAFEAAVQKGHFIALTELAAIYLARPEDDDETLVRQSFEKANQFYLQAHKLSKNNPIPRLWKLIYHSTEPLTSRIEQCLKLIDTRADSEVLEMLTILKQKHLKKFIRTTLPAYLIGNICTSKLYVQMTFEHLIKAFDNYESVNNLEFSKEIMSLAYLELGEKFKEKIREHQGPLPDRVMTCFKSCYEKAAAGNEIKALVMLIECHEEGFYGFEKSLDKTLKYAEKMLELCPEDEALRSKVDAIKKPLRSLEPAVERPKSTKVRHHSPKAPFKIILDEPEREELVVSVAAPKVDTIQPSPLRDLPRVEVSFEITDHHIVSVKPTPSPKDDRIEKLQQQLRAAEREMGKYRSRLQNMSSLHQEQLTRQRTQCAELKEQSESLQTQLCKARDALAEFEAKGATDEGKTQKILQLEAEMSQLRHQLSRKTHIMSSLQRELNASKRTIRRLRTDYQHLIHRTSDMLRAEARYPRFFTHIQPIYLIPSEAPAPQFCNHLTWSADGQHLLVYGEPISEEFAAIWFNYCKLHENKPSAQYNLGICYLTGTHVNPDKLRALSYFQSALESHIEAAACFVQRLKLEVKLELGERKMPEASELKRRNSM